MIDLKGLGFGGAGQNKTLPKVLAELQGLTFSLVTGAAADAAIALTGIEAEDTIAAVLNMTDLTQLDPADFTVADRRAKGTLTIDAALEDGDVVSVNGKAYTFKEVATHSNITRNNAPQVVPIVVGASGVDVERVAADLAKTIMSADATMFASADEDGVVTITFRTAGTAGNAKTLAVTASNGHVTRSGATLAGGSASGGFSGADDTSTKKLLVIWYNKQAAS